MSFFLLRLRRSPLYIYPLFIIRHQDPKGKILIIGGGIANFTDVAATFTGIQKAMKQYREELLEAKVCLCMSVCLCVCLCLLHVT